MHVALWKNVLLSVLIVAALLLVEVWSWRRSLAQARRLRDLVDTDGDSGLHSKALVRQRRVWRFRVWALIPIGLVILVGGVLDAVSEGDGNWHSVIAPAVGLGLLSTAVSRWRCLRILKQAAHTAATSDAAQIQN